MKIENTSKIYSTQLVREVINFVKPSGISNFDVMVKNSKKDFYGRAYTQGSGYHCTAKPFIVARVGKVKLPYYRKGWDGYLPMTCYTQTELLVHLIAHELRHLWQASHKRGKVWGAKGRFSELDADAYAIKMVRKWRNK